ncbi:MAG: RecQ family ATP-dependent DNA helicase [Conchiformibius sp.]|nr:RecQ family ATP-dependent DNA helicase [Conchiformibius sp.]
MLIAYIDLETDRDKHQIRDIGAVCGNHQLHSRNLAELLPTIRTADYICGHNFLAHDYAYIRAELEQINKNQNHIIDTLLLSPLLFPARPYHALNKDYKTAFAESNNPLTDCLITRDLLESEQEAFFRLPENLQTIFYSLLGQTDGFAAFFRAIGFQAACENLMGLIQNTFNHLICAHAPLAEWMAQSPTALAYALSLIYCQQRHAITPSWLLHQHPEVEQIVTQLCATPCEATCHYCQQHLDIVHNLKKYFGYSGFREYDGKPLQAQAAQAAVLQQSLLAVFPTGGGKSITFQIPALMAGEYAKALTVIISPLQSLMKDQVDNLMQRDITEAVTINGLLDPIERQKALERVADGSASLLYIAPESLRSRTIERLLLGRNIARFVIDEAHCFSAWGQDFRVDYLYIGEFIRRIQQQKQLAHPIPVSCFTATAKPQVIDDIKHYFQAELNLDLALFTAKVARKNLSYQVLPQKNDEERYQTLRQLIQQHHCPTIVYVSRTRKTEDVAEQLCADGFTALPYHGKMDKEVKIFNQNEFISGNVQIMVATSAFGMGVDKKDVGLVVHYQISDSLENYVQEAGRAGRDEQIQAACYVLFQAEDLDKHFILLNQTKIAQKEINQIWKAVKDLCGKRSQIAESALNIARQAGWHDEHVDEIETRVTTAIAALEQAGYVKRGQNMPRVYANSILAKNAAEAIEKIEQSTLIHPDQKNNAVRIIKKLFSQRSQIRATDEEAESRLDYMADVLGLKTENVVKIVSWLRQEGVLADQQDLRAFIRTNRRANDILLTQLENFAQLEQALLAKLGQEGALTGSLKSLNQAFSDSLKFVNPKIIKSLLNFWKTKNWLARTENAHDEIALSLKLPAQDAAKWIKRKLVLAQFVMRHLYSLLQEQTEDSDEKQDFAYLEFSVGELQTAFKQQNQLLGQTVTLDELEDTLFYLLRMDLLKIEGGFLVVYQRLNVERLILDNRKQYTKDDYSQLARYYQTRQEQIHIVGKYAKTMIDDVQAALNLVNDYFSLEYRQFLRQYFPKNEADSLKRNMTDERFQQWFGNLSPMQSQIILDNQSQYIVVFAAPGSGKTRVLVHKLASLYQLEDAKHEQLLMLTFSRAAAYEFKSRLFELIGNAAARVEIKTFHSYCFDLLGRVGDLAQSDDVIAQAVAKIRAGEVESNRIAKLVLVLDEAQDINAMQFELVKTLMAHNEEMRVIAVGDDDQTIYTFMGASPDYMRQLLNDFGARKYELSENYRSQTHIVHFCNRFAEHISQRLKTHAVSAVQTETGKVDYVAFSGCVLPDLLQRVQAAQGRTAAVLTQTNEEAIWLSGQLRQAGIACKLVQTNDGFKVGDLLEVRIFEHYLNLHGQARIDEDDWQNAKSKTQRYLARSTHLPLLNNLWQSFEHSHPQLKYVSDWQIFIQESKLEDFYRTDNQMVFVSTIHKAKGREYDDVFVYLNRVRLQDDNDKRLLYVAFSRAKANLTVFSDSPALQALCTDATQHVYHGAPQVQAQELVLYLTHRNVNLGCFEEDADAVRCLQSGDILSANINGCFDGMGRRTVLFAKRFHDTLKQHHEKGYRIRRAEVNFVVMWRNPDTGKESRIVLPIVYLYRNDNTALPMP